MKAGIVSDVEARDALTKVVHTVNEAVASQLTDMGVLHERLAQYFDLSFASNSTMKAHAVFFLEKLLDNATLSEDAVEALTSFKYTGDPAPERLLPLVQLESIQAWRDDVWHTYKHMVIWLIIWQLIQYFLQPRFLTERSATPADGRMDQAWSSYNSRILSHFTPHIQGWEPSSRSGAVVSRWEQRHHLPTGMIFSCHPLRNLTTRLFRHRLWEVTHGFALFGWPMGSIDNDSPTTVLVKSLPGQGAANPVPFCQWWMDERGVSGTGERTRQCTPARPCER